MVKNMVCLIHTGIFLWNHLWSACRPRINKAFSLIFFTHVENMEFGFKLLKQLGALRIIAVESDRDEGKYFSKVARVKMLGRKSSGMGNNQRVILLPYPMQ